jgi:hypothetical protein
MICEHALTEFCECIARRPPVYVAPHVEMRGPGERLPPWSCQCDLPRYKRHKDRIACQPQEDVFAFQVKHGIKNQSVARALRFIESFAP